MRAAICRMHGPPETVVIDAIDPPALGPGGVLVEVQHAAVNFADVLLVANRYQVRVPAPFVPGSEFAGVVRAVGAGVDAVAVGDRVCGMAMVGAFAEHIVVPASSLERIPAGIASDRAAAFPVAHGTAYHALRSAAVVQPRETMLVLGAAGGVGLAAVELGVALGARVLAAASTPEKLAACREQGAMATIDVTRESLKDQVKALTEGRGVDVVIDPVGGALAEEAVRATGWRGRFVSIGFASGDIPRIPLNLLLLKGAQLLAFNMALLARHEPDVMAAQRRDLWHLLASGRLRPRIDAVYALDDVVRALRHVADRRAIGKVVIAIDGVTTPSYTGLP